MSSNCTDTSNEDYQLYWFHYFVSIGYIDNSNVNLYAPFGKCTRSLLWLTYLINIVHFFLLSSGILYLLFSHRNRSEFWWLFINWISSFAFLIASIALFVLLSTFETEYRYQRCLLLLFIIILFLIQIGCFTAQALITLHCLFNLKFISSFLDYAYWSAIIAVSGTIVSTLLLDYIFIWCGERKMLPRVNLAPISQQNENHNRASSPVDSIILEDFHRQSGASLSHLYNNNDQTRRFHIQPTNRQSDGKISSVLQKRNLGGKSSENGLSTTIDA